MRPGFCTSAVLTENTLFGIDPSLERNYLEGVLPMAITTVTDATAITVGIEATATVRWYTYGYYGGGCGWLYRNAVATGSSYWWSR